MAMPSGHIEKIGMIFIKREFERIVFYPSGSGDKAEII